MGKLFTMEDAKAAFNLFHCVYGIRTLGMFPARPGIAVGALLFVAFTNVYSSVVCSKVMLVASKSVRTLGDLGEWCMGTPGRWLTVIRRWASAFSCPVRSSCSVAFCWTRFFPGVFKATTWIILMTLSLLSICLPPALKEGTGAVFAGCVDTVLADVIGIGVLIHGMRGHPSVPSPDLVRPGRVDLWESVARVRRRHCDPSAPARVLTARTHGACNWRHAHIHFDPIYSTRQHGLQMPGAQVHSIADRSRCVARARVGTAQRPLSRPPRLCVGASAIMICRIVLPIAFYFKKLDQHPAVRKGRGLANLFNPEPVDPDAPSFPFCDADKENKVSYNYTAAHST